MTMLPAPEVDALEQRWARVRTRAALLRRELASVAVEVDRDNIDTELAMRRLWQEGVFELSVPTRFDGLSTGSPSFQTARFCETLLDATAADSSAGQNLVVQTVAAYEVFADHNGLPEETKAEIARRIRDDGLRLVSSASEAGSQPVAATKVPGGIVLTGTKTFNSNSGNGGLANVAVLPGGMDGVAGMWHALVPLEDPAVELHGDWDPMGQRGTQSQSITFHGVFVPDGWHFGGHGMAGPMLPLVFLMHACILLGTGYGAFDAACVYVRGMDRATLPEFHHATEDPLVRRRIGEYAAELEGARAYLLQCARDIEQMAVDTDDAIDVFMESVGVKITCAKAALHVSGDLFELTGARSTSNRYRLDRFWRNARTFASHDPTEAKEVWLGDWQLSGSVPAAMAFLRV